MSDKPYKKLMKTVLTDGEFFAEPDGLRVELCLRAHSGPKDAANVKVGSCSACPFFVNTKTAQVLAEFFADLADHLREEESNCERY